MVWIFIPPGASSTWANSCRARRIVAASGAWPVRVSSQPASLSSAAVAQSASRSDRRFDISAAAALVKVRQRIFAGGVPASISDSTRSVSTLVLPVPAEAATQTLASGSAAWRWLAAASPFLRSLAAVGSWSSRSPDRDDPALGVSSGLIYSSPPMPADHSWTRARWS